MNKKQIEKLFDLYEDIQKDESKINELLEILNTSNYNFCTILSELFDNMLNILTLNNLELREEINYLIYETWLWKNKLNNWENYYIDTLGWKKYILTSKEDCITYLLENDLITLK